MVGRFGAGAGRRRRARVGRLAGFLLCATACCGGPCAADVVRLKNGTLLEGRIVAEDDRALVLEIMGGRMQIPRADVLSVTREALRPEPRKAAPARAPDAGADAAAAGGAAGDAAAAAAAAYAEADGDARVALLRKLGETPDAEGVPLLLRALAEREYFPRREAGRVLLAWLRAAAAPGGGAVVAPPGEVPAPGTAPAGAGASSAETAAAKADVAGAALDAFFRAVESAPEETAAAACAALAELPPEARLCAGYASWLRASGPRVRAAAAYALGEARAADHLPALAEVAALDPDAGVRVAAVIALGKLRRVDAAAGTLLERLRDPNAAVRAAATRALQQLTGRPYPENYEAWELWLRTSGGAPPAPGR